MVRKIVWFDQHLPIFLQNHGIQPNNILDEQACVISDLCLRILQLLPVLFRLTIIIFIQELILIILLEKLVVENRITNKNELETVQESLFHLEYVLRCVEDLLAIFDLYQGEVETPDQATQQS